MGVYEKNLDLIETSLEEQESIISAITSTVRDTSQRGNLGATGALVLTNKRIIFRGGGGLVPRTSRDTRLSSVTAFETNNSSKVSFFTFVTLKINFSGGSDEFFIKPDDAESFLSAARTALTNNQVTSSSRVEVSDELQKLGTLFTQGILDEQEFKAAKAKLLGL
jgi:hypothetical protein